MVEDSNGAAAKKKKKKKKKLNKKNDNDLGADGFEEDNQILLGGNQNMPDDD